MRVEDGQGGSNTIEVTINLIDQQEPPEAPAAPGVSAASSTSLTVTWDEPANTGPDVHDYDVQYRQGDSGSFRSWTHNSAERTAEITSLTPGTSYQVQVRARNDEGASDWSPSGTGSTDPNQLPVFTDGSSATRALDENTTGVQDVGDPVGATDPENTTLTYSLQGTDADSFTVHSSSGQLRTRSGKTWDYEATSNYSVEVKATDGHSGERTIPVSIELNDLNEPPTFTSDAAFEAAENQTFAGRVTAEDVDSGDNIAGYTVTGGADQALFEVNSSGVLTFKDAPDFEQPSDAGGNNENIVEVTATGGAGGRALTVAQTITVTVENVDEPPGKPDPPTVSGETENSLTVTWTEPANTGPDVTNYHVQYRISGAFTDWPDTGPSLTRTLTGLRSGSTYQIRVQAENDEGKGAWSNSVNGTTLTGPLPTITILRGPYLQSGKSSGVIIKWRTDEATESVVHYGLDPNSLTLSASNATSTTEHAVQLTGLSADVKYFYSVGTSSGALAGGDRDHFVVTAPVPGTAKPTRIWVTGCPGTANANAGAVRDAFLEFTASRDPDLWIMLGDNAYSDGTDDEYQRAVFETYPQVLPRTVLWPTLGNHDGHTADSTTESGPYYDIFSLPRNGEAGGVASGTEAYYSFDHGNIHFIVLDSYETDRSPDGAMMTWLEADLQANDKEWVIAFWHHPPYSKGTRDSDTQERSIELRQNAVPLLERYGVDLVLTAHSHSYERSYLIDGHYGLSATFTDAMKKNPGDGSATGDGAYQKPETVGAPHAGAVYVVAGTAGKRKSGPFGHPAMAVSMATLGSMVLDVNGNRLDAKFLDSTRTGAVILDAFTILKLPEVSGSVAENTAAGEEVVTVAADENPEDDRTYTLAGANGNSDHTPFTITAGGELQTRAALDYEQPTDADGNGIYEVVVNKADTDDSVIVTIHVADVDEPPGAPVRPGVQPASSTSLTVTWDEPANTGPDVDDYDVQYREGDSGSFTSWTHNSAERTATITGRSPGTSYEVQVRARNDEGASDWSPSGTGSTGANEAPVFTDGSSATRNLDENTTGVQDIGDPVSATDPENTALTYSLEGTDADAFAIDTRNGQLRTKSDQTYNYETKPRYVVSVKANDGHGGERTILVLIDLTDVNEPPVFTSDDAFKVDENEQFAGRVTALDVDRNDGITGYEVTGGADGSRFEIANTNELRFKDAPDFERPADAGGNNEYLVEITATGGADTRVLTETQTVTVTVEDADEPPGKPDPPTVSDETENGLTVTWTEPANTGPDVTNYHVQYRISGTFTDWPDTGPSPTRTITGLSSGSTYQIRVQADNDEGEGAWSNSVNGTTLTAPSPTILRGPYLQSGTSSSVIIKWRTDEATESVVHYGLDPNSLTLSASNATSTTEHAVQLTGLSADVKYFYSVGTSSVTLAGGDRDHFVVTAPVPGTAKPTRIWVIGDSGTANRSARAVRNAFLELTGSRDPDLWIMLGDNAYNEGTDNEYQAAVFNTYPQVLPRTVLWPTLGNHGAGTSDSATESGPYYDIFSLPRNGEAGGVPSGTEAYYSFDYGNLHLVCLNSETDLSPDGAMMTWLEADLAANDKEWIIAFWHRAPYSRGSANSDTDSRQIALRQNAVPLLERYGVDLVLTGHTHAYERSYLVDGHYGLSDTFTDAMKKNPGDGSATGDGAYQKPATVGAPHAGAVYVVAGTAGVIKTQGWLDHPAMAVSFKILGSMVLDVNGNRLDAIFLGSTRIGDGIRDAFTILKLPEVSGSVAENTAAGEEVVAVAGENPEADRTYSLAGLNGHSDHTPFTITAQGELQTAAVLNYEQPADADGNNIYEVVVSAEDGEAGAGNEADTDDSILVTIHVTDVDEAGTVRLSPDEPQAQTPLTATLNDPDRDPDNPDHAVIWRWWRSTTPPTDPNSWIAASGPVTSSVNSSEYTPQSGDVTRYLRATATYKDRHHTASNPTPPVSAVSARVQAAP